MNFNACDVHDPSEGIPSLACVDPLPSERPEYKIKYPQPREFRIWPDASVVGYGCGVENAAEYLLSAIEASEANPNRPSAQGKWFVCPKCDFHSPQYSPHCRRCGYTFPSERMAVAAGLYRCPVLSKGAIAPAKSIDSRSVKARIKTIEPWRQDDGGEMLFLWLDITYMQVVRLDKRGVVIRQTFDGLSRDVPGTLEFKYSLDAPACVSMAASAAGALTAGDVIEIVAPRQQNAVHG